jgi:histidine triad (HIT) family protein
MPPAAVKCAFCDIVQGVTAAHVVHADEHVVAFLDVKPVFPGHVLVVPRPHHETLTDLPPDLLGPLFRTVRRLARAVEAGMEAQGTFVAMNNRVSQSVPHLHVHVVPRRKKDGLRGFFWPRTTYGSVEQAEQVAEVIRRAVAATPLE